MTTRHDYLMLALATVLLITNCLGAAFTIKRNRIGRYQQRSTKRASSSVALGWAGIYGRLAVVQGITVIGVLFATAIGFLPSSVIGFSKSIAEFIQRLF